MRQIQRKPVRDGLGANPVPVLEDDGTPLPVAEHPLDVGGERVEDGAAEARVVRVGLGSRRSGEAAGDVPPQRIVGGRLVGDDIELDAVGEKPRDDVCGVADEGDGPRPARVEVRRESFVVAGDEVDPAVA